MSFLKKIVEDHLWYPATLLYLAVIGFAAGMLIGYLL